jgi:signal transduction histidine kinase
MEKASGKPMLINRNRLIVVPMALVLTALVLVSIIGYFTSRQVLLEQTESSGRELAEQIVAQIQGNFASEQLVQQLIDEQIQSIINLVIVEIASLDEKRLRVIAQESNVDEISVFQPSGDVLYTSHLQKVQRITIGSALHNFLKGTEASYYVNGDDVITGENFRYGVVRLENGNLLQVGVSIDRLVNLTKQFRFQSLVSQLAENKNIILAKIVNSSNRVIASSHLEKIGTTPEVPEVTEMIQANGVSIPEVLSIYRNHTMKVVAPVVRDGAVVYVLLLTLSTELTEFHLNQMLIVFALVSLVAIILFLILQKRNVIDPVLEFDRNIAQIDLENAREFRLQLDPSNAFKGLEVNINATLDKAQEYFNALKGEKSALEVSEKKYRELYANKQDELTLVLEELISREKLASLGALVAGVAHEINTPLGVAISATSFIEDSKIKSFKEFESGLLTQESLEDFYNTLDECIALTEKNLNCAAELVNSFKSIAVGQLQEDETEFNLKELTTDVVRSLNYELKTNQHVVEVHCQDELTIKGYSGALSQVFTNLIINSILHGFEQKREGHIVIHIEKIADWIRINYRDDGQGMDAQTKSRIFEPFFTLKKGKGGTGLGMTIVHNIIVSKFGGRMSVDSQLGSGTTFYMEFKVG